MLRGSYKQAKQNNGTQVGDLWDDEAGVTSGGQNYGERGEEP